MSATTLDSPRDVVPATDRVRPAPAPIPFRRVAGVELRKMFDTRSGFWLMASILIAALLATGAVILFAPDDQISYGVFATAFGFPMAVILPMIAILSVTSEWSQRSGLTTFTLVPRRGRVIAAAAGWERWRPCSLSSRSFWQVSPGSACGSCCCSRPPASSIMPASRSPTSHFSPTIPASAAKRRRATC